MSRKTKKGVGFVLVLAAALAIGAMATLSAHGDESNNPHFTAFNTKTTKHEPTTLTATSESPATFKLNYTIKCTHPEYEIVFAEEVSEVLTMHAKYAGTEGETESTHCGTTGGLKAHVKMEGCHFKFFIISELSPSLSTGGTDIICPAGSEIDIQVTKGGLTCTIQIPAQNSVTHIYYSVLATDITVEPILQLFKYKTTGGPLACGVANGNYTGEFTTQTTLTGINGKSEAMDFTIHPVVTKP